jgi:hypothetical protein
MDPIRQALDARPDKQTARESLPARSRTQSVEDEIARDHASGQADRGEAQHQLVLLDQKGGGDNGHVLVQERHEIEGDRLCDMRPGDGLNELDDAVQGKNLMARARLTRKT